MKSQPKNVKELIELINRYESITLEEISNTWITTYNTANKLTGFGDFKTCSLCKKVGYKDNMPNCEDCVFETLTGCFSSLPDVKNKSTYSAIHDAYFPEDLLQAFRNRAAYLKERFKVLIKDYKNKNNETRVKI